MSWTSLQPACLPPRSLMRCRIWRSRTYRLACGLRLAISIIRCWLRDHLGRRSVVARSRAVDFAAVQHRVAEREKARHGKGERPCNLPRGARSRRHRVDEGCRFQSVAGATRAAATGSVGSMRKHIERAFTPCADGNVAKRAAVVECWRAAG